MKCIAVVSSAYCLKMKSNTSDCLKGTCTCSNVCICSFSEDILPGIKTHCQTSHSSTSSAGFQIASSPLRVFFWLKSIQAVILLFHTFMHPLITIFLTRVSKTVSSSNAIFMLHCRKHIIFAAYCDSGVSLLRDVFQKKKKKGLQGGMTSYQSKYCRSSASLCGAAQYAPNACLPSSPFLLMLYFL